jgi:hypothetical protein
MPGLSVLKFAETTSVPLDFRGSVPLIMTCVHWGWPPSLPPVVGSGGWAARPACAPDLRARRNSPRGSDPPRN